MDETDDDAENYDNDANGDDDHDHDHDNDDDNDDDEIIWQDLVGVVATWLLGVITTMPALSPASIIACHHHHHHHRDSDDDDDGDYGDAHDIYDDNTFQIHHLLILLQSMDCERNYEKE